MIAWKGQIRFRTFYKLLPNEESTYRTFYKLPRLSSMRQGSHEDNNSDTRCYNVNRAACSNKLSHIPQATTTLHKLPHVPQAKIKDSHWKSMKVFVKAQALLIFLHCEQETSDSCSIRSQFESSCLPQSSWPESNSLDGFPT